VIIFEDRIKLIYIEYKLARRDYMYSKIEVDYNRARFGYLYGRIENYKWFALVQDSEVSYGINLKTLDAGMGRVVRLCIYKESYINNNQDKRWGKVFKNLVIADYKRRWETINLEHKDIIERLVNYLDRRYSLIIVK